MKSIDKLRTAARNMAKGRELENHEECNLLLVIADEIEAEIAERYMLLPVDADGVPIHCGERMRLDNGHEGDVWLIGVFDIMMSDHTCFDWAKSRHVKPRTLEDILCDALADVSCMGDGIVRSFKPDEPYVAELAAEIRELMEVD